LDLHIKFNVSGPVAKYEARLLVTVIPYVDSTLSLLYDIDSWPTLIIWLTLASVLDVEQLPGRIFLKRPS
jgi:hypothetical protein